MASAEMGQVEMGKEAADLGVPMIRNLLLRPVRLAASRRPVVQARPRPRLAPRAVHKPQLLDPIRVRKGLVELRPPLLMAGVAADMATGQVEMGVDQLRLQILSRMNFAFCSVRLSRAKP